MSSPEALALVRPPIAEVVCGVRFRPLPAFDTLHHGLFWARIRDRYPRSEVHPLLADPASRIVSDVPLQRTWFIAGDEEYVIQVQIDRFYVNWRRRGGPYPGFSGPHGIHDRFDREFDGFRVFLRDALDVVPTVEGIELSKVDLLHRGSDWTDDADLGAMIPSLRSVVGGAPIEQLNVNVALARPVDHGVLQSVFRTVHGPGGPRVHAEFRLTAPAPEPEAWGALFNRSNDALNEAFFAEFPDAGRRFGSGVQ